MAANPLNREEMAHLQQLVRDLIQGDTKLPNTEADGFDHTPYIIKQVFQSAREEAFSEQLSVFVGRKETEIEKEFVQSIDQLLKVRTGTSSMREKIISLNRIIQETGSRQIEKKKELIENQNNLYNLELALESVQACLFVLDIASRVTSQISNRKYFSALRMVQELQENQVKLVQDYSFSKLILEWIPQVQNNVRNAVLQELKEWYILVKNTSFKVGKLAMQITMSRYEKVSSILSSDISTKKNKLKASTASLGKPMELAINEELENDATKSEDINLDFTCLFQCIHIHDVLGKRPQLRIEFEENRRIQADQVIKSVFSLKDGSTCEFEKYLHQVAGFFVIEATVMGATQEFRARSTVETLWEVATNQMRAHMIESLGKCVDPKIFLEMKGYINAFIQTMNVYGYAIGNLGDLLLSLLDRFGELIRTNHGDEIIRIVNEFDKYVPITVSNNSELQNVIAAISVPPEFLPKSENGAIIFPLTLPFSEGVPLACAEIRKMIDRFYLFSEGFSQQSNEIDDLLKKTLENTLTHTFNGSYRDRLNSGSLSLAIQIMTNSQWISHACSQFEKMIQDRRYINLTRCANRGMRVSLTSTDAFDETRKQSEKRIFAIVNAKLAGFLEVIDYNWTSTVSRGTHSPVVEELVGFLDTLSASALSVLPDAVRSKVYFEAFDHLAHSIKCMVTTSKTPLITVESLQTLDKDVSYLEKIVKTTSDTSASDSFTELRQLLAYGKSQAFDDILNPSIKQKKYTRVEYSDVIMMLEKLGNINVSYFSGTSSQDKQTKKLIDDVVKSLKLLTQ